MNLIKELNRCNVIRMVGLLTHVTPEQALAPQPAQQMARLIAAFF
jgi:hypothetical protein